MVLCCLQQVQPDGQPDGREPGQKPGSEEAHLHPPLADRQIFAQAVIQRPAGVHQEIIQTRRRAAWSRSASMCASILARYSCCA